MQQANVGPRTCVLIPALNAEGTIGAVVEEARRSVSDTIVVDDGSWDATRHQAAERGATVLRHDSNRGKGAALRSGLLYAQSRGFRVAITLDADGQHPPAQILRLLRVASDPHALVIGVRDLAAAGAPRANQRSNAFSNWFLSLATRRALLDTQCGFRRYPVDAVISLGVEDNGFAFEAEVLIRALHAGIPLLHVPIDVTYPPNRTTHFDSRRDPWRIVGRVLRTLAL